MSEDFEVLADQTSELRLQIEDVAQRIASATEETDIGELERESSRLGEENDRLREELDRFEENPIYQLRSGKLPVQDEALRIVVAAVFLFFSYIVGEASLLWGRFLCLAGDLNLRMNERIARVAEFENQVITNELDRLESRISMYSGLAALPLALFHGSVVNVLFHGWRFVDELAIAAIMCLSPLLLTYVYRKDVGKNLDDILRAFDDRNSK